MVRKGDASPGVKQRAKVVTVVGARPNFMKAAPLLRQFDLRRDKFDHVLLHTGQHSDPLMNEVFFADLGLPQPNVNLGISGGTHGEQTGRMLIGIEGVLLKEVPQCVVVVGDVNSSLAASLCAAKLQIPVAHVEAGLRSFNRRMPEEINRLVIDHLSSFLFTHEASARANLLRENVDPERIYFVGNIMVDSLLWGLEKAKASSRILEQLKLTPKSYGVMTLHRPENVDDSDTLQELLEAVAEIARDIRLVWPVHPRTRNRVQAFKMGEAIESIGGLLMVDPLGYLDFLKLMDSSRFVLTDSGGIQEETTALGIPCLTLRKETERPVTVLEGTNTIVGTDKGSIVQAVSCILNGQAKTGRIPEFWDGRTAERIVGILERGLG